MIGGKKAEGLCDVFQFVKVDGALHGLGELGAKETFEQGNEEDAVAEVFVQVCHLEGDFLQERVGPFGERFLLDGEALQLHGGGRSIDRLAVEEVHAAEGVRRNDDEESGADVNCCREPF